MPFTQSCKNIRLDNAILHAECRTYDKNPIYKKSEIDLDTVLGNHNGKFQWGLTGFSKHAKAISLDQSILTADLLRSSGDYAKVTVDLSTHIINDDGVLKAVNLPHKPTPTPIQSPLASDHATAVISKTSSESESSLATLASAKTLVEESHHETHHETHSEFHSQFFASKTTKKR